MPNHEVGRISVEKPRRWRRGTLVSVFIVAVAVNYLWELAQAPFYVRMEIYNSAVFRHCLVASLGDGLMVLLIVAAGRITLRQQNWFQQSDVSGYLVTLITGFIMAVMVEWLGVHILRRWEYSEKMPMLPGLNIGLIPIAQMLFLPPLIFRIVAVLESKKIWKSSRL